MNQASDVERATAKLSAEQEDVAQLESELTAKISDLERILDPISEALEKITLKPLKKNITVFALGLAWLPVRKS